jgi:hypothetical protein
MRTQADLACSLSSCRECGCLVSSYTWVPYGRPAGEVETWVYDLMFEERLQAGRLLGVSRAAMHGFGMNPGRRHQCPPIDPARLREEPAGVGCDELG